MIGLLGSVGLKAIICAVGAVSVASCGAYAIHSLKAAGASELALQMSQETIQAQHAENERRKAAVARLTDRNAKLQDEAANRAREVSDALSAIPNAPADTTCPANCVLPPLS